MMYTSEKGKFTAAPGVTREEILRHAVVGLADLVREVHQHGRTARFDQRAPQLLEEARAVLGVKK